ncbi:MAG TPA: hypothetical protein VKK79_07005 [Candidatus Lokiarchaeia archaeon]|nr:hypothetical protein [Candidatus Lokiarchaeia archaeon]
MPREEPKEYVLSLRIPINLNEEIEEVATKENLTKSDYIRKAISDAISFSVTLRQNQTFLIDQEMVKFALEFMEDIDIEEFATLSIQNGRKILKSYLNKNVNSSIVQKYLDDKKTIVSGLLIYITQSILSPTGQNWFKRVLFSWTGDVVTITGTHDLGLKFSEFMHYYFVKFFAIFNYEELKENVILKEDRIKLKFQGENKEFDINILLT